MYKNLINIYRDNTLNTTISEFDSSCGQNNIIEDVNDTCFT